MKTTREQISEQIQKDKLQKYNTALCKAISYMLHCDLHLSTALEEAASHEGIEWGEKLQFESWAKAELEERGVWL